MSVETLDNPVRLATLGATGLMDTLPEPDFDRVTRLVCAVLKCEISLVSLVDDTRQFFKSSCGLPADLRGTPLSHSFCQYVVTSGEALIVEDARIHPLVRENLAIRDLNVIAYLGIPLHAPDGPVIGSLCAIETVPRKWTDEDERLLREFAGIVEATIALRNRTVGALDLAQRNDTLAREYNHRAANIVAVAQALVRLSEREATSAADLAATIKRRLFAYGDANRALIETGSALELGPLLTRILNPYVQSGDRLQLDGPVVSLTSGQISPVCLVMHELATNSAKYGAISAGWLPAIAWTTDDGMLALQWQEATPETPAVEAAAGTGYGSTLLDLATRQLGGTISRAQEPGRLSVDWQFPLAASL